MVTVDDVVKEAGVAKGTFYVHFDSLEALTRRSRKNLSRLSMKCCSRAALSFEEPALRVAFEGCTFIDKALADPGGPVLSREWLRSPEGRRDFPGRLFEDLQQFSDGLPGSPASAELNQEIVVGIMLQLLRAIGEGRLPSLDRDAAVGAILHAIGLDEDEVDRCAPASHPRWCEACCARFVEVTATACRRQRWP